MENYILFPFRIKPQRRAVQPLFHVALGHFGRSKKHRCEAESNQKVPFFYSHHVKELAQR